MVKGEARVQNLPVCSPKVREMLHDTKSGRGAFVYFYWGLFSGIRILLILGITLTLAWGHAVVVKSSPADQSVLTQAPGVITLCFNVKIEKAFARASLWSTKARLKIPPIPKHNFAQDADPACLHISLPPLKPGAYQVRYKILATDGHTTEGMVRFAVNESE